MREPEAVSSPQNEPTVDPDKTLLPFEDRKKRLLWIWIPVVIGLGLLVAAGYVGGRILTKPQASSEPSVAAPVAQTATAAPVTSSNSTSQSEITPVAPAVSSAASADPAKPTPSNSQAAPDPKGVDPKGLDPKGLDVITPQPGERYIQISALNTEAARRYVNELRNGPLEPHLAPGPTPTLLRVLIGPFKDAASLSSTRSDLLAAGIDCFVREY